MTCKPARSAFRLVLISALACLLSACWVTATPLLGPDNGNAIDFAGTYYEQNAEELLVIKQDEGVRYLTGDAANLSPSFYRALGEGWYVLQLELNDKEGEFKSAGDEPMMIYFYVLLRHVDDTILMYDAVCDEELGSIQGVQMSDEACSFVSADGLYAAAKNVRSRIESGTLDVEVQVFGAKAVTSPDGDAQAYPVITPKAEEPTSAPVTEPVTGEAS